MKKPGQVDSCSTGRPPEIEESVEKIDLLPYPHVANSMAAIGAPDFKNIPAALLTPEFMARWAHLFKQPGDMPKAIEEAAGGGEK